MPYARANDIDIYYEWVGHDDGRPPLVLTHGFAGPSRHWKPELYELTKARRLLLYDVRGHDRTTVLRNREDYSMQAFAADLAGLLRELGIERAHIGGESMGGMVTAQFAADYPEMCASVLLSDTTCGNGESDGAAGDWERRLVQGIGALSHLVEEHGLLETLKREQAWKEENDPHLADSPYSFEDDVERIKLMKPEGYIGAAHAIKARPDLTSRIGGIRAPTLVMVGGWDDFLPCALRDHELIPGSRLVVRERCGHGTRWRLETWTREVEAFLADVEAGRPVAGERRV